MVTKSKAPTTTLEEAPDSAAESSPPANDTSDAPAAADAAEAKTDDGGENVEDSANIKKKKTKKVKKGADGEDKKEGDDGEKKKKVKKVIPSWATISVEARSKMSKSSLAKPKIQDAIISAIKLCADGKGVASASAIKSMIMSENPDCPKMVLRKGVAKAIERGLVKQVKGKGLSGSFKLGPGKPVKSAKKEGAKTEKGKKKSAKDAGPKNDPMETVFPLVFTWACNPKEASVGLIRKYLVSNYPNIDLGEDSKKYKKALELAEKNGQLERLTGKGYSGTFRLVDGASKLGNEFGDAFENALIAMNEPKQLSVSKLRDYLGVYHPEYNTDNRPDGLKKALDRAVAKGWLNQVSGKGFSGTYRLMHPYYPGPRELWGKDFVEAKAKDEDAPKKKAKKRAAESDDDEDEDEDEEEEAYKPTKKRGAPTPRKTAEAPAKKKVKKVVAKKSKPAKVVKKAPAKKAAKAKKEDKEEDEAPAVEEKSSAKEKKGGSRGRGKK